MSTDDTGESTASINRRQDERAWPDIESALRDGATLYRPPRLRDFYTRGLNPKDRREGRCLSAARVRRLVNEGVLMRVGVDEYGLTEDAAGTPPSAA